ncbi:MAG: transposase, partial [Acidimicrobiia bacterium]|nr:transposase [Acidimicrobiia bacterium]
TLWAAGGLDFDELAIDIAIEVRQIKALDAEIAALDDRIEALYEAADPAGIVASAPGIGITSAAGILARTGDLNRFDNLAGIRAFTGLVRAPRPRPALPAGAVCRPITTSSERPAATALRHDRRARVHSRLG